MSPLLTANATLMFIHDLGSGIVLTEKLVELMYGTVGLLLGQIQQSILSVCLLKQFKVHESLSRVDFHNSV